MCDKLTKIRTDWEKIFDIATAHCIEKSIVMFGKEYQPAEYAFKVERSQSEEEIGAEVFCKVISNIEKCVLLSMFQFPNTFTPFDSGKFEFFNQVVRINFQEFVTISSLSSYLDTMLKRALEMGKSKKYSFCMIRRMPEWEVRQTFDMEHMVNAYYCYSRFTFGFYSSEG